MEILSYFLKTKQGDKEELLDYLLRFKNKRDVMFCLMGKGFLDGLSEALPDYVKCATDAESKKFKENKLKKFNPMLFLRKLDKITLVKSCLSTVSSLQTYWKCIHK